MIWPIRRRETVFEHEGAMLFRDGRLSGGLPPGRHLVRRRRDVVERVDVRRRITVVAGQEVLAADRVTLKLSVAIEWSVSDPERAYRAAADPEPSLYLAAQLALREVVAEREAEAVLRERAQHGPAIAPAVVARGEEVGANVAAVAVKDVLLPAELRAAYSEPARARQEAAAKLERARGETAALRNLANAGRLIEEHPGLARLRLLDLLGKRDDGPQPWGGGGAGSSLIVHLPDDLFGPGRDAGDGGNG